CRQGRTRDNQRDDRRRCRRIERWQANRERSASAGSRFTRDGSAVAFDDRFTDLQAQSGSLLSLGREEWLPDVLGNVLTHAAAIIGHGNLHQCVTANQREANSTVLSIPDCKGGVLKQINQYLLKLDAIRPDPRIA